MGSRGIFMLKICDPSRISLRHTSLNGRRLSALCGQRQVKLLAQRCVLPTSNFYPTTKSPNSVQLYCKNSSNPVDEKAKIEQMPKDRVENIFTIPNFLTVISPYFFYYYAKKFVFSAFIHFAGQPYGYVSSFGIFGHSSKLPYSLGFICCGWSNRSCKITYFKLNNNLNFKNL